MVRYLPGVEVAVMGSVSAARVQLIATAGGAVLSQAAMR